MLLHYAGDLGKTLGFRIRYKSCRGRFRSNGCSVAENMVEKSNAFSTVRGLLHTVLFSLVSVFGAVYEVLSASSRNSPLLS